jgi:hypothetical protein
MQHNRVFVLNSFVLHAVLTSIRMMTPVNWPALKNIASLSAV